MIRIITPFYNSEKYVQKMISSAASQNYTKFKQYIFDDMSTDNSVNIIKDNIKASDDRFEIITNKEKFYSCGNHWQCLQKEEIKDDDVCITLDGDDWFADEYVLDRVNCYYGDPNILMTFGQFVQYNDGNYISGFAKEPNNWNDIRNNVFTYSHLRTFKAGLFRKIKRDDLLSPNNTFWEIAGDLAMIYPMMEMARKNKIKFVKDVNYI
jgi:glycosyltransferase involved in cell wall biosynthesis